MKEKLERIVESIFSISLIIAILGGGIIFCMFLIAIIIGGESGEVIAVNASKKVMPHFIRLSSIAILCGLIKTYIHGEHTLALEENE